MSLDRTIGRPRVCVKVKRIGRSRKYEIQEGIHVLKPDTVVTDLPESWKIVDADGNEVRPTGRFVITVDTIDPYHLVADLF
jgi:tRNA A58 N-methylase Trm61